MIIRSYPFSTVGGIFTVLKNVLPLQYTLEVGQHNFFMTLLKKTNRISKNIGMYIFYEIVYNLKDHWRSHYVLLLNQ